MTRRDYTSVFSENSTTRSRIIRSAVFQFILSITFFSFFLMYICTFDLKRDFSIFLLFLPFLLLLSVISFKHDSLKYFQEAAFSRKTLCTVPALAVSCKLVRDLFSEFFSPVLYENRGSSTLKRFYDLMPLSTSGKNIVTWIVLICAAVIFTLCIASCLCFLTSVKDYRKSCKQLFLPALAVSFIVFFITPAEILLNNSIDFDCSFVDFCLSQIVYCALITIVLSLLLALLKTEFCQCVRTVLTAFAVMAVIQKLFLNPDTGNIDQKYIDWNSFSSQFIPNVLIWLCLISLFLFIGYKLKLYNHIFQTIVLVIALAMQITSISTLVLSNISTTGSSSEEQFYLSGDGQYTLGEDGNIIILCLDCFSNDYFDVLIENDDDLKDALKDFTYFSNYNSYINSTTPSVTYYLTGEDFDPAISFDEWYERAWHSTRSDYFYSALRSEGFDTYLYAESIGKADNLTGIASNVRNLDDYKCTTNYLSIRAYFSKLGLYLCVPTAFKETIFNKIPNSRFQIYEGQSAIEHTNYGYYEALTSDGFSIVSGKRFVYSHLEGCHSPYHTDQNCGYSLHATESETLYGCATLLKEYIHQLKASNVYDNSTIIIMADHGNGFAACYQGLFLIKCPGQVQTSIAVNCAPVGHEGFQATILDSYGLDWESFGISDFSVSESIQKERTYMVFEKNPDYADVYEYGTHSFSHDANTMKEYAYTGDRDDLKAVVRSGQFSRITQLAEAPW